MNLREERARIYKDMRSLLDDNAEGGMSADQAEKYGQLESEVQRLTEDIEARDRAEKLEERMEKPRPVDEALTRGRAQKYTDEQKEYERAFNAYIRGDRKAEQYLERGQTVGTTTEGGFTVPDVFRNKLVDRIVSFGGLAGEAEVITTASGAPMEWVTLDDTANEGEIAAEEAAGASGADLVFGQKTLGSFKYVAPGADNTGADPLRVSVELLQDSAFDIESMVVNKLGQRIARKQATDWVVGAGTTEPEGITTPAASVVLTGQVLTKDEIIDILHALDPAYRPGAKWLVSDVTLASLRKLEDTTGRPLLQDFASSGIGGSIGGFSLLGHPVVIDQAMVDIDAGLSSKAVVFGDLRESYVIRRVRDVQLVVDPYTRAAFGQVAYTVWARADGVIQNDDSFVVAGTAAA